MVNFLYLFREEHTYSDDDPRYYVRSEKRFREITPEIYDGFLDRISENESKMVIRDDDAGYNTVTTFFEDFHFLPLECLIDIMKIYHEDYHNSFSLIKKTLFK